MSTNFRNKLSMVAVTLAAVLAVAAHVTLILI